MGLCATQQKLEDHKGKNTNSTKQKGKIKQKSKYQNHEFKSSILSKSQKIIIQKQVFSLVQKYLKSSFSTKIVYRGSESHYSAHSFHEASNGKQNTILLAKTTQNRIFGAFTPCVWKKDTMYEYQSDQGLKSFLFCLIQKKQHKQQVTSQQKEKQKQKIGCQIFKIKDKQKAIMNHSLSGPVFGQGHDIFISDKCNLNQSWCNLGKSYFCNYPFGSNKANNALTGQQKFLVVQYELWEVKSAKQLTQHVQSITYDNIKE